MAPDPLSVNKVFASVQWRRSEARRIRGQQAVFHRRVRLRAVACLSASRKTLEKDKDALEARMVVIQQRYMKQFTALDSMLSQLQSTSSSA